MQAATIFDDSLRARRESFDRIPVLNIAPLLDGSDVVRVARDIRWALENVGFFYVRNHGVPEVIVENCFEAARAFFALPMEEKMALHIGKSDIALRGYIEVFGENTDPANTMDLKECFDVGPERAAGATPFFGPNPWPSSPPDFRRRVMAYHDAMRALSRDVLRGVAISLGLAPGFFEDRMRDPISIQRLLRYPPQTGRIDRSMIGIGAHTDYGSLTILAQDDVGGLQVMNRDGAWVEAPPLPGTFVVNIGDLLQRLTNDVYLANLHRVVNAGGRERHSIPFFIDADYDAVFAPLAGCVSSNNPARYEPVTCGIHKFRRFRDSFPHLAGAA
jgi:isopenicillin N synthase-like dioxygenase